MTPAQVTTYARAYSKCLDAEQSRRNVDLYNLAVLIGSVTLAKNPKSFGDIFPEQVKPKEDMTDEQMYSQVQMLNALFGGKEVS